jgi:hypothetical protein
LAGAATIYLALAQPFIASDAAVGFIRLFFLLFFKGSHGLGEEPRLGHFFPTEKGLAPAAFRFISEFSLKLIVVIIKQWRLGELVIF